MTSSSKYHLGWTLLLASALTACSGVGDFAGSSKASDSPKKSDGNEGDPADEPQQVAGAFLMDCSFVDTDTVFGCTAKDKKTKQAFAKEDHTFSLMLLNDAGDEMEMQSEVAPAASEFQVLGVLPAAYKDSGSIKMTVNGGDGVPLSARVSTREIKKQDSNELGNHEIEFSTENASPIDASNLKLTSFVVQKSWTGRLGLVANTAVPGDFCKDGQIRTQLSTKAQILSTGITSIFQAKTAASPDSVEMNIVPLTGGATTIGVKTTICFQPFARSLGGHTELAHIGDGCVFVKYNAKGLGPTILIGTDTLPDGSKVNLDDLRAFVSEKNKDPSCN